MASRTPSGAPSAEERRASGGGPGLKKGSFPVFDTRSAMDALDLRGHSSNPNAVADKVLHWAEAHGDAAAAAAARKDGAK